jgi:hypothetical protein
MKPEFNNTLSIKMVWQVQCIKCGYAFYTDVPPEDTSCRACNPLGHYSYTKNASGGTSV